MPLDPRSPLRRFLVDPRAVRREQIGRLTALGVALSEIPAARSLPLLARFVREFLDPARVPEVSAELARTRGTPRGLDFDRWLRPECVTSGGQGRRASLGQRALGCIGWLLSGSVEGGAGPAVRFERRADLPALAIDLATLDDAWAASWPGVFVRFDVGRAVVVTLDYEEIRCDLHAGGATPYR